MREKACDMIKAALAADSLALGVHWVYDVEQISKRVSRVDHLLAPGPGSFHPSKKKGAFTHYGDQILVLLESVAASGGFVSDDFFQRWQTLFDGYDGYMDSATQSTLKQIGQGKGFDRCGSQSNDLAGAARGVVVSAWLRDDPETMGKAVRAVTRMTHQDAETVNAADFFSRVSLACLKGTAPAEAMRIVANTEFQDSAVGMWVDQGLKAAEQDSLSAVLRFGQSCHTPEALPGVVQIIAKYEENLSEALIQSVMAGGDNAARASLVAQVLAAWQGMDGMTRGWFEDLVLADHIAGLLEKMP